MRAMFKIKTNSKTPQIAALVGFSLLLGFASPPAFSQTVSTVQSGSASAEDWKGPSDPADLHLGAFLGLGVLDSSAGFLISGTASKKIVRRGFVEDINNSVSVELQPGVLFVRSSSAFVYSAHLRWDFQKDDHWTLYALGGLGGAITSSALGNRFILLPRFGVGAFYQIHPIFALRAELSREVIAVGAVLPLGF